MASATISPPASDQANARSADRVPWHELDRALRAWRARVGMAGRVEVLSEGHVEGRGATRVLGARRADRLPGELDDARSGTDLARESGGPRAERARSSPRARRVADLAPHREGPLEMGERFGQAEHCFRLAGRYDRCGERLRVAAGRRPVRRDLPAGGAPLRASSSASRTWTASRSPGRIVAYTASASRAWRKRNCRGLVGDDMPCSTADAANRAPRAPTSPSSA